MQLVITPGGTLRCVYDEAVDLSSVGRSVIFRASHVEPDQNGSWHADLSPVGGPFLGPFSQRSAALAAEGEGKTLLILERTLEEQLEAVIAHDCPIEITLNDLAVFALARDIYAVECERIGRPPRDAWIDDLGRHEFTRILLGLPFSPLVFQLILKSS